MIIDTILKRALLLVWTLVGAALFGMLFGISMWIDRIALEMKDTAHNVAALASHLDVQLNGTTAQHGTDGAVFAAKKSLDDVRGAAVIVSKQEKQYYKMLQTHTGLAFTGAEMTLLKMNEKLDGIDTAGISTDTRALLVALTTDAQHMVPLIDSLRDTIRKLGDEIDDPDIKAAIKALLGTAQGTQEFMVQLNAIIADVQGSVHVATHMNKKQRALSALLTALKTLYYVSQVIK